MILDFYKDVLTSLSFKVDDNGLVSFVSPGGDSRPTTVEGKRLVLPTNARLKEGFDEDLQPFHPISENIARKGVSPVLALLKRTAHALSAHYFSTIAENLLIVAADPALHKDLPPDCSEYLKKVSQADKKCLKNFQDLVKKAIQKKQLVSLYLKNGGSYQGEKVNRLCVIRFPLMTALETDEKNVLGVDLREKDKKTIKALLHYIMPFGDDAEEYSAGSNARVAPFFDAFLKAWFKVADRLNLMVHRYRKPIEMDLAPINLKYHKQLDKLDQMYGKIPSLRGNEGGLSKEEEIKQEAAAQPDPAPSPQRTPPQKPVNKPASSGGGMSVDEFLGRNRNPQQPPPHQPYPPQQGGYQQPQQGYGGYPPQQPYPPQQGGYQQPMPWGQPQQQPPATAGWLGGGQPQPPQQHPFQQGFQQWANTTQQPPQQHNGGGLI